MNLDTIANLPFYYWLGALFGVSYFVMAVVGRPMIAWLKGLRGMKWSAREDTPDTHAAKAGTPSMGGLGILFSAAMAYVALISTMLLVIANSPGGASGLPFPTAGNATTPAPINQQHTALSLALLPVLTLLHMALGLADDWSKATGRGGLRARAKFAGQLALAIGFLLSLYWLTANQSLNGVRFFASGTNGDFLFPANDLVVLFGVFAFLMIVIVGTCNAVNITDGIDGLAAGLCVQVGFAFWLAGSGPAGGDVKQWSDAWWLALAGACAGFLIYNRHKARVFMGDTGSLALGAALGAAAVMTRTVFLLPFIGLVFFIELLSVTTQVAYFKYTKRKSGVGQRIFKRAPLHHHFELSGWSEKRVVFVFWTVNLVASAVGLALWGANVLPRFP